MPAQRKITEEAEKEIVTKYEKEEKSLTILAKEYLVSAMTIRKYLLKNNIQLRPDYFNRRFKTEEELNELKEAWLSGMTQEQLKNHFECGWAAIRTGLRNANIRAKLRRQERIKFSPTIQHKIEKMWTDGKSAKTIAKSLDVDRTTICKWLESKNYTIEPRTERQLNHSWVGGRINCNNGYIRLLPEKIDPSFVCMINRDGYILEHRYIMAKFLDRPLLQSETVHHINGIRNDNRIENLQLRHGNHGPGVVLQCLDCGSHNIVPIPI